MALVGLPKTEDEAREYLEHIRWPSGPVCPRCGVENAYRLSAHSESKRGVRGGVLKCRACRKQFTVTVGTIMEGSHISLVKWVMAFHLLCSSKKGMSALQLQRNLGIGSYKSAWHLAHRIRYAMTQEPLAHMLKGTVEVDETYVGGVTRGKGRVGKGSPSKTPVVALVERGGAVRPRVIGRVNAKTLKQAIRDFVDPEATIYTDDASIYRKLGQEYRHESVNHTNGEYVRGKVHTNTVESFFALLKRGTYGTFHHVSRKHLHRYCEEFGFRWTWRKVKDEVRSRMAIKAGEGKRLYYRTPTASVPLILEGIASSVVCDDLE